MSNASTRSGRSGLVTLALVLATIAAFGAVSGVWLRRQVLGNRGWTDTSAHLLADRDVRAAVADVAVRDLFADLQIQRTLGEVLPAQLASTALHTLNGLALRLAGSILAGRAAHDVWDTANRQAHRQLLAILAGHRRGPVYLDLSPLLRDLISALDASAPVQAIPGASERLFSVGAPHPGRLRVLTAAQVDRARTTVNAVQRLTVVLAIAAVALFALAILAARGWRTGALVAVGWCVAIVGGAALGARALAGPALADQLVPASAPVVRRGVEAAWLIGSDQLRTLAIGLLIAGGALVLVGLVARAAVRSSRRSRAAGQGNVPHRGPPR